MTDNVATIDANIATDELDTLNGVAQGAPKPHAQRVKPIFGQDNEGTDVSLINGMPVQAVGELIEALEAQRFALVALMNTFGRALPDVAGRMRVAIDAISASLTLATITTVGTVTTVSTVTSVTNLANQTSIGGNPAFEQVPALMRIAADSLRAKISVT